MARCYLCGRILSEHPANASECQCHDEHIIPNAIGGHLTDRHILCKDCGGSLSSSDAEFASIFSSFIVLLKQAGLLRSLDRNSNAVRPINGSIFKDKSVSSPSIDILYKGGKAVPSKPSYILDEVNKKIDIFADSKTAKSYIAYVKKVIAKESNNPDDFNFVCHSDLLSEGFLGLCFSKGKPKFNEYFKNGLLKMAVEMALHFGLQREQLNNVLDVNQKTGEVTYKEQVYIFPFVPLSLPDIIFENERYNLDPNFPSHIVKVYSEQTNEKGVKNLWCYIDLFSTFQYYVLLSNSYIGKDIDETYAQKLKSNQYPSQEELSSLAPKDLFIEISKAGLSSQKIKGLSSKDKIKLILEKYRTQSAEYNLYLSLAPIYSKILEQLQLILLDNEKTKTLITLDPSSADICQNLIKKEGLTPSEIRKININSINKEYFRKVDFLKVNNGLEGHSYPSDCSNLFTYHKEIVQKYTNVKFSHLSYYCLTKSGLNSI